MDTKRIEEIQKETAYPDSISVQQALLKVWNECEQEKVVNKNDLLPDVSNCPSELEPVLAKIEHINSLGKSSWYEVVFFDKHWRCYDGSDTFKDGEKVVKWRYCKDCC